MHKIQEFIILIIFIGFITFLPSLFGNFVWDDEDFVTENQYVKTFQIDKFFTRNAIEGRGKISNYYRPIQFTVYALIYKVAGPNPFVFHLAGILLHITAAVFAFLFLMKLWGYIDSHKNSPTVPFLISLVFLIHPIQTESVTYISGLSDALFSCFMFLSILFFIQEPRTNKQITLSILFFILSLFSKELGIMTLGILFWIIIFFRKKHRKNDLPLFFIFCGICLLFFIARFTIFQFDSIATAWQGTVYGSSVFNRIGTFFRSFFDYVLVMIFPKDLYMERDFSLTVLPSLFTIWTAIFTITIITVITVITVIKKNRSILFFFFLSFLTCMLPFTGITLLNGIFYEHYLYVPLLFFWGCIISLLFQYLPRKVFITALSIITILFLARSYIRQYDWIDNIRFYEQTLIRAPKSIRIINNLGMEYAQKGLFQEAITTYQKGINLDKHVPNLYHNSANSYLGLGDLAKAKLFFQKAIDINPSFIFSYYPLIELYQKTGETKKAKLLEEKARIQFPDNPDFKEMLRL